MAEFPRLTTCPASVGSLSIFVLLQSFEFRYISTHLLVIYNCQRYFVYFSLLIGWLSLCATSWFPFRWSNHFRLSSVRLALLLFATFSWLVNLQICCFYFHFLGHECRQSATVMRLECLRYTNKKFYNCQSSMSAYIFKLLLSVQQSVLRVECNLSTDFLEYHRKNRQRG